MVDRSLSQRFRWGAMCDFEVYRLLGRSHAAVRSPIVTGELTNVQNEPRTIGARTPRAAAASPSTDQASAVGKLFLIDLGI